MLAMETIIVNLTSLAARRALGSTKERGQSSIAKPAWMQARMMESSIVSPESS